MISFLIDGEAVAKERARIGKGFAYNPKKTSDYENWVRLSYLMEHGRKSLLTGALEIVIMAYFKIPKSYTKKQLQEIESGDLRPRKKDCDNIAKSILDALNGIAYEDDRQVYRLFVEKLYAEKDYAKVIIRQRGEER